MKLWERILKIITEECTCSNCGSTEPEDCKDCIKEMTIKLRGNWKPGEKP